MPVIGRRVLRCHDGHLFVSTESERLFGSIHVGWWRMMQCPVDGSFRMCGNVQQKTLRPDQIDALQRYGQWPAPAMPSVGSIGTPAPAPPPSPLPLSPDGRWRWDGARWVPNQLPPAPSGGPAPAAPPTDDETHRIQALSKMKELLDAGVVTQQEFEVEKQRILRQ